MCVQIVFLCVSTAFRLLLYTAVWGENFTAVFMENMYDVVLTVVTLEASS